MIGLYVTDYGPVQIGPREEWVFEEAAKAREFGMTECISLTREQRLICDILRTAKHKARIV